MTLVEALLPEFDREMGLTRRLLARIPDGRSAWQPHPTSMTLGRLAEHLAELPQWALMTMTERRHEVVTTGRPVEHQPPATRDAVVAKFDEHVAAGRAALVGKSDGELMAPWTLVDSGKELFTMPKTAVLRNFVLNHLVHHRGQLSVYLRMLGVPIPSIYGPSGEK